jgi:hypothetical protein
LISSPYAARETIIACCRENREGGQNGLQVYVGIGNAMLALIASKASVTPAQSDSVPTAMVAATALLRWDEAVGVVTP